MRSSIRTKFHVGFFSIIGLLLVLLMNPGPAFANSLSLPLILKNYDGSNPPPNPTVPTILTTSPLPAATLGVNYSQTLQARGGTTPYAWAITGSVLLPTGLSLNPGTGVISGIPVNTGTSTFQVKVTDVNALSSTKDFSLAVNPATQSGSPAPPDGLNYTSILTTSIALTWNDNSNNETYFEIWRAKDQMTTFTLFTTSTNHTWQDTGLTADTLYCYKVRAHNGTGDSAFSNPFCAWTETTVKPRPPTNVTCKVISGTEVLVNWTNNSYSDKYNGCIELDGALSCADILELNIDGWVVYNINIPWTNVRAKIRAHNGFGYSDYSAFSASVSNPGTSATTNKMRITNNSAYPIISLKINNVEQFPQSPQGLAPGWYIDLPATPGTSYSYQASNGFWSGSSRSTLYNFSGSWTQPSGTYSITIENPSIAQLLTKFSTSGYYLGEYWTGYPVTYGYKGFRFYNNGNYTYYVNGIQQGTGSYSLVSYPGSYTVTFGLSGFPGVNGYFSETGGDFSMRNGPTDWPYIDYNHAGN
jgi:hypothetical protein